MDLKAILVFGAGDNQVLLIRACKELGYRTVVVDVSQDPIGKAEADAFFCIDGNDFQAHKQLIIEQKIDGIVTCQMENPLPLMAELADFFGFCFPSKEAISKARNKYLMKQAFLKEGVACATGQKYSREDILSYEKAVEKFGEQFIIKPVDAFSSRGVFLIRNKAAFEKYVELSFANSKTSRILVEEFLEGNEVSVEGVVYQGLVTIVQITDKVITPYPHTVELEHHQPSQLTKEIQEKISVLVEQAVKSIGLDNSGFHAEAMVTKNGPKMIEIGARLGGDYISSYLTFHSCGVDLNKAVAQIAMGYEPDLRRGDEKYAMVRYYNWKPGEKVQTINSIVDIRKHPNVVKVEIFVKEGDVLPEIVDSAKRHSVIILASENKDILKGLKTSFDQKMNNLIKTSLK